MTRTLTFTACLLLMLGACSDSRDKAAPPAAASASQSEGAPKVEAEHEHEEEHAHDHEGEDSGEGDEHDHAHEEGEPDFASIDPARAAELGIEVATAGGGPIDETLMLTGRLIIDPRRVAAVRARFPGPVVAVRKEMGDPVSRGETLARVESNESLTTYDVTSPLGGVVLARNTNVGDVAGSEALFTVGDVGALQAELQAFGSAATVLRAGTAVRVERDGESVPGRIESIAPELESRTQARRLRVSFAEAARMRGTPGEFVTAQVQTGVAKPADVAVPLEAIRKLENRDVVFIPEEKGFRARPVKVGRRGLTSAEILEGLDAGEQYVARGAFVLKADIGKNMAEHEH